MILNLLLAILGVGVLAGLLFSAAVYALPVVAGIWLLQEGLLHWALPPVASVMLAVTGGALIYGVGHVVFETRTFPGLRMSVALLFVVPAAFAGYALALALLGAGTAPVLWTRLLAGLGGLLVGGVTLARLLGGRPRRS